MTGKQCIFKQNSERLKGADFRAFLVLGMQAYAIRKDTVNI